MNFASNLRGVFEEHNPFLFGNECKGYRRHADCTVYLFGHICIIQILLRTDGI